MCSSEYATQMAAFSIPLEKLILLKAGEGFSTYRCVLSFYQHCHSFKISMTFSLAHCVLPSMWQLKRDSLVINHKFVCFQNLGLTKCHHLCRALLAAPFLFSFYQVQSAFLLKVLIFLSPLENFLAIC